jgi:hypothetical protein
MAERRLTGEALDVPAEDPYRSAFHPEHLAEFFRRLNVPVPDQRTPLVWLMRTSIDTMRRSSTRAEAKSRSGPCFGDG